MQLAEVPADRPRRVLVVDDDAASLSLFLAMFGRLGVEVDTVSHAEEALDLLRKNHYSVVFLDLVMPGMSGIDMTRAVRFGDAGEHNRDVLLIAVTAMAMREDREHAIEAGVNSVLVKPIRFDVIKDFVAEHFGTNGE